MASYATPTLTTPNNNLRHHPATSEVLNTKFRTLPRPVSGARQRTNVRRKCQYTKVFFNFGNILLLSISMLTIMHQVSAKYGTSQQVS